MLGKIRNVKFVNIFWMLFYIFLFGLLLRGGFSYLDPDFGWHLKVGEEISQTGKVPVANIYNYTYTGNWVNHEWLSDWLVYQIYSSVGYQALVLLFAVLIVLVAIILNVYWQKNSEQQPLILVVAFLQAAGIFASLPHFGVRIQELALLFVLGLLIILAKYEKTRSFLWLSFLPPGLYLWANLHASFLLGLVLMFSWLGIKISEKILFSRWPRSKITSYLQLDKVLSNKELLVCAIFSVAALISTALTPYRLGLYDFLAGYKNSAYLSLIREWLPQHVFPLLYSQLFYLALGAIALVMYVHKRWQKEQGVDAWKIFLVLVFLILSFKSRRHFPLFFVVSFGLMVEANSEFFSGLKIKWRRGTKIVALSTLALVACYQFYVLRPVAGPFKNFCSDYPCAAVDFLRAEQEYLDVNIFNQYDWGGFLIWTWPEKKIFIDGRLPQVEMNGQTFIEEYYSFMKEDSDKNARLSDYNIELVLLPSQDATIKISKFEKLFFGFTENSFRPNNHLRLYLEEASEWQEIYTDDVAKIFVLKNSGAAPLTPLVY